MPDTFRSWYQVPRSKVEPDVIDQLAKDFNGKCYICEIKPVQDPQVEHRLPHYNRNIPERVFDWNNLFYSCSHCNSVKNSGKYEEGIIDCCVRDPEDLLMKKNIDGRSNRMQKRREWSRGWSRG